jgi:cytoskeletal protein CcmA (bactofilin family)
MFRRRGKGPRRSELTAFIDDGSEIEGRYTFRGTVMLNGKFTGEISSEDTLIIGERAVVHADVRAGRVQVSGEVTGNLRATERVDLRRTARVYGDVEAPVVVVEEGVVFEGHCRMAKPSPVSEVPSTRDLAVVPFKR